MNNFFNLKQKSMPLALEIGTTKLSICNPFDSHTQILSAKSDGFLKGRVIDRLVAAETLSQLLTKAEDCFEQPCSDVLVGLDASLLSKCVETRRFDLNGSALNPKKLNMIYETFAHPLSIYKHTKWHRLDGILELGDPCGLSCERLDVEMHSYHVDSGDIKELIGVCNQSGLRVIDIHADMFACFYCLKSLLTIPNYMVIDIGGMVSKLLVVENHNSISDFSSIHAGATSITNDVMHAFKISQSEAEHLIMHYGISGDFSPFFLQDSHLDRIDQDKLRAIIVPRVDELIELIEIAISRTDCLNTISHCVMLGGGSLIKGLKERMSEQLSIEVIELQQGTTNLSSQNLSILGLAKIVQQKYPYYDQGNAPLQNARLYITHLAKELELV